MLQTASRNGTKPAPQPKAWAAKTGQPTPSVRSSGIGNRQPGDQQTVVRRGQTIFDEGDPALYFYKLISGSARLVKILADGSRQICDFLLPGDLFGFSNSDDHEFSAEAIEDSSFMRYRRSEIDALISSDSQFAAELQKLTARGLHGAYEHMIHLCHRSARDRLAGFLLAMARRSTTKSEWINLPMTHCDIADYLGMAHETVSRAFTQLKKTGAIAEIDLNRIKLVNRQFLERGRKAA